MTSKIIARLLDFLGYTIWRLTKTYRENGIQAFLLQEAAKTNG
jgi:hypothetical protein